jgi:hypothetical protein
LKRKKQASCPLGAGDPSRRGTPMKKELCAGRPMKLDVLLFGEDGHLALAIQTLLSERGFLVMSEPDANEVAARINECDPDLILSVTTDAVVGYRRREAEVFSLERPFKSDALLDCVEPSAKVLRSD